MKIVPGKRIKDYPSALRLALSEAGAENMQSSVLDLFTPLIEASKLTSEAQKSLNAAIRSRYKGNPVWSGSRWYIPVPKPGFDFRGTPRLILEIQAYLVAAGEVDTATHYYTLSLVGPVGKSETISLPIIFLQALLDQDLGRFNILARSQGLTTWDIPGFKPVEIRDDWLQRLVKVLQKKSVADWLLDFGTAGRSVMPLVAGTLFGITFRETTPVPPLGQQPWTYDSLIQALQAMAYNFSEAKQMVDRALPTLRPEMTLEEALRYVLQYSTQGGQA